MQPPNRRMLLHWTWQRQSRGIWPQAGEFQGWKAVLTTPLTLWTASGTGVMPTDRWQAKLKVHGSRRAQSHVLPCLLPLTSSLSSVV